MTENETEIDGWNPVAEPHTLMSHGYRLEEDVVIEIVKVLMPALMDDTLVSRSVSLKQGGECGLDLTVKLHTTHLRPPTVERVRAAVQPVLDRFCVSMEWYYGKTEEFADLNARGYFWDDKHTFDPSYV